MAKSEIGVLLPQGDRLACESDYALCQAIQRQHGKSYYFATCFFPIELRRAVFALYAFVRYPDQWVDCADTSDRGSIEARLNAYRDEFLKAVRGERVQMPVLRAFAEVVRHYRIPLRYPLAFLEAMRSDLYQARYPTLEALQGYMWGSAAVVGLMMCHLMHSTAPEVLQRAIYMGYAMQMTNFLRDIGEDWQRGRIYLPQDEMQAYGVTETHLAQGVVDEAFRALMQFQINRCRRWYAIAEEGIAALPYEAQYPVLLGSRLYARILNCIERNGYEVFRHRAQTSYGEKLRIALHTFILWRHGRWVSTSN